MAKPPPDDPNSRVVCRNRRAKHEYELLDQLECGIVLSGTEVKSIRAGKISIEEAYVRVKEHEAWLHNCDIAEYPQASWLNHESKRVRKLLMHRRELRKFAETGEHKGLTMVPLEVYFLNGRVKVRIALAKGKKLHDKRESLKKQDAQREIRQAMTRKR